MAAAPSGRCRIFPVALPQGAAQRQGPACTPFEEMENPIICSFFSQCEASEHSAAVECGLAACSSAVPPLPPAWEGLQVTVDGHHLQNP